MRVLAHHMTRVHEAQYAKRAGLLSLGVHALLFLVLVMSFSWQSKPMNYAEVELWDALPAAEVLPKPEPKVEPKPEPEPEPKPEPKLEEPKPVIEPKPEPQPEPKPEIVLKKEKPKPEKKVEKPKEKVEKKEDELEKLKKMMAEEDAAAVEETADKQAKTQASKAASADEVNKFIAKIQQKIRSRVNKQLCGNGKPELEFKINLIPGGELAGAPELMKGSGIEACDEAVERAILQAQPLPVPDDRDLFAQFRNMQLRFRPNED